MNIGQWARRNPAASRQTLLDLQTLIAGGRLVPHIVRTCDLPDGSAALR